MTAGPMLHCTDLPPGPLTALLDRHTASAPLAGTSVAQTRSSSSGLAPSNAGTASRPPQPPIWELPRSSACAWFMRARRSRKCNAYAAAARVPCAQTRPAACR